MKNHVLAAAATSNGAEELLASGSHQSTGSPSRSKVLRGGVDAGTAGASNISAKLCNFTLECTAQLNKCAAWFCKSRSAGGTKLGLKSKGRSPSVDMLHHATSTISSSPAGTGAVDDDSQPPARNCYRLIVLG